MNAFEVISRLEHGGLSKVEITRMMLDIPKYQWRIEGGLWRELHEHCPFLDSAGCLLHPLDCDGCRYEVCDQKKCYWCIRGVNE